MRALRASLTATSFLGLQPQPPDLLSSVVGGAAVRIVGGCGVIVLRGVEDFDKERSVWASV